MGNGLLGGRPGDGGRNEGNGDVDVSSLVRMAWNSLEISELGPKSIDRSEFRELIEPSSVPAGPRSFCASLDIGIPVRSGMGPKSISLLARKESVDITLRKVLLSGDSFWLSEIEPTLFLEIDLNLL